MRIFFLFNFWPNKSNLKFNETRGEESTTFLFVYLSFFEFLKSCRFIFSLFQLYLFFLFQSQICLTGFILWSKWRLLSALVNNTVRMFQCFNIRREKKSNRKYLIIRYLLISHFWYHLKAVNLNLESIKSISSKNSLLDWILNYVN